LMTVMDYFMKNFPTIHIPDTWDRPYRKHLRVGCPIFAQEGECSVLGRKSGQHPMGFNLITDRNPLRTANKAKIYGSEKTQMICGPSAAHGMGGHGTKLR